MITLKPQFLKELVSGLGSTEVRAKLTAKLEEKKYRILPSGLNELVFDDGPALALRGNWEPIQLSNGTFYFIDTNGGITVKLQYHISLWWQAMWGVLFTALAIFQDIGYLILVVFLILITLFTYQREHSEAKELLDACR